MKKIVLFLIIIAIAIGAGYFVYKTFFAERDYNVIFFTLDTTRADYIDTGEGAKAKTPVLKEISRTSLVCKNAYTTIPITMPSHTSIFTGVFPYEAGVFNNGESYEGKHQTLAEIFKKRGYVTGAVISLGVLLKEHKLDKGFDYYIDDFSKAFPAYFLPANVVTKRGLKLLKKVKDKKFFLWLHYSDPHEPYAPPSFKKIVRIKLNNKVVKYFNLYDVIPLKIKLELNRGKNTLFFTQLKYLKLFMPFPLRIKNLKILEKDSNVKISFLNTKIFKRRNLLILNHKSFFELYSPKKQKITLSFSVKPNLPSSSKIMLYEREVEYMDNQIGKIIDYLKKNKLFEKTVLVFVGDHGEGLGEYHDNFGHIHFLRPQYTRVPLIIKFPNSSKKTITKNPVSTIDIVPTLLKYMRFKEKNLRISGTPILKSKSNRVIFSYTYRPESYFNGISILYKNHMFLKYTGMKIFEEFLDLTKNDGYTLSDNLIKDPRYLNEIKKMRKLAKIKLKEARRKKARGVFSEETKKILKSLGYL